MGIDRGGLHYILWRRAGRNGTLHLVQTRLADELQLSKFTLNRVVATMVSEGRIVPLQKSAHRPSTYKVIEPEAWYRDHPDAEQ